MPQVSSSAISSRFWRWFHRFATPQYFDSFANKWIARLGVITALLFTFGLVGGLVLAPADYQQGDSFRIIYVHVPAAWMGMFVYVVMAAAGAITLIWRMKLADAVARASAPLGAAFTFLALATGSLWGRPMWGTYWEWDARIVSELILLLLYLGYIALNSAIIERRSAARASAILAIVGVVNLPIIHYSVEWWHTLHQGPTISKFAKPSIDIQMLIPLLILFFAYQFYYLTVLFMRVRNELLDSERRTQWVADLVNRESAAIRNPHHE